MRNRIAIGLAGGYWGGRTLQGAEKHCLTASDFTAHTAQELDEFTVPSDDAAEQRPRPPATWDDWLRRVKRAIGIWALVYGEEWRPQLTACIDGLERLGDEHPTIFPREALKDIWEELAWRFWEELKEVLRRLKQHIGRDNVRRQELILYALTPDEQGHAWLRMPPTFDLNHSEGWFRQSILPRIERRQQRVMWDLAWKGAKGAPAGGRAAGEEERAGGGAAPPTAPPKKVYPAGKLLTPAEVKEANEHKPVDAQGRPLCWAALSHMGCARPAAECGRSHAPLRGKLADLHWTVQAQLVRRGGLRTAKLIPPEEIDGRIAQLRAGAKAADEAAKSEGGGRRGGGEGPVLAPPAVAEAGGGEGRKAAGAGAGGPRN